MLTFSFQGNPVSMFVLQTLVLYECEKHPREEDWEEVRYIIMVMSLVVRVAVVVVKLLVTMVLLLMVVMVKLVQWLWLFCL